MKLLIPNKYDIKYLIDIHGLAKWRECDINLGTNLGSNIEEDISIFNKLINMLANNFKTEIDNPFMASGNTICSYIKKKFDIWTLQIEINCGITNYKYNIVKYKILLENLISWLNSFTENK